MIKALELSESFYGKHSIESIAANSNLGLLYLEIRAFDKAEYHLILALEGNINLLGRNNVRTGKAYLNLAQVYFEKKVYNMSQKYLINAKLILLKFFDVDHERITSIDYNLKLIDKERNNRSFQG